MDFSAAQRAAHAEEYAETMMSLHESRLVADAYATQRQAYVDQAGQFLQHCEMHFWWSATRVGKNGSLVEPGKWM